MALQHLQHLLHLLHLLYRLRGAVPIWVHCPAQGTQVFRVLQFSGGLPYPALDLRSRNPDRNPNPNLNRRPYQPAPSSKSAPCATGRGLAFVDGRSAMRSKLSIQAIGLIGQIEKIEHVGIRKIPGRSESRHC
jgi:hypothetical protein